MTKVAITQDLGDITRAIERAFDLLAPEALFRGKLVAVKPNETWASPDDVAGVTQADTLRAVIRLVKNCSPSHIVVTGGSGAAETDDVMRYSGMMQVIEDEGVEYFDHNRPPFMEVRLSYGGDPETQGPQESVMVNPRVLEYERLLVLSQLKLHATATVTLALKNIAMSYPAADYYGHPRSRQVHEHRFFDDMHSFIVAMHRRFPIDLAVTVGHPAMVATGPLGGYPAETGMVIASRDAVAADSVGAKVLGFDVQAVRHLWEAGLAGLGETDLDKVDYPGMDLEEAFGAFTEAVYGRRLTLDHP